MIPITQDRVSGPGAQSLQNLVWITVSPLDPESAFWQMTSGLEHLHGQGIVHRDLKLSNILISKSSSHLRVVITDYGLITAFYNGDPRYYYAKPRTPSRTGWRAPEVLKADDSEISLPDFSLFGKPIDILSLGCLAFYAMTDGGHPFGTEYHRDYNIHTGASPTKEPLVIQGEVDIANLISEMISANSSVRRVYITHPFSLDLTKNHEQA